MGTTAKGLHYPEPTDPTYAGADAIKTLATDVDVKLHSDQRGQITVALTSGIGNTTVTFPTAFPGGPTVLLTSAAITSSAPCLANLTAVSTTSFSARLFHTAGTYSGNVTLYWVAFYF